MFPHIKLISKVNWSNYSTIFYCYMPLSNHSPKIHRQRSAKINTLVLPNSYRKKRLKRLLFPHKKVWWRHRTHNASRRDNGGAFQTRSKTLSYSATVRRVRLKDQFIIACLIHTPFDETLILMTKKSNWTEENRNFPKVCLWV